jgi:peptidoglycan/LPS O-acetylase OafA/YrhL
MLPFYLAATYTVAWASYRYFESPFLRLKDRPFWRSKPVARPADPSPVIAKQQGHAGARPVEIKS